MVYLDNDVAGVAPLISKADAIDPGSNLRPDHRRNLVRSVSNRVFLGVPFERIPPRRSDSVR